MPLLIMCGFPCSGKTTVVAMLRDAIQKRLPDLKTIVIAELGSVDHNAAAGDDQRYKIFSDSKKEREMRARHKSEIERALTQGPGVLVISDADNYIKGYRYELYCLAKSLRHQHLILYCDVPVEQVIEWNSKAHLYSEELINELVSRFELPNPSNRWDQPMLIANPHLWSQESGEFEHLVNSLVDLLINDQQSCVQPNRATQLSTNLSSDFLQVLDRVIQQVIDHITNSISMGLSFVELPKELISKDYEKKQILVAGQERQFTRANLGRIKRRYINMQRTHAPESSPIDPSSIAQGFFQYLSAQVLQE